MAAKCASADTDAADDLGLVTDSDLAQLDPRLKYTGKILDQLSEIDSAVRRKVKQYFIVIKSIFRIDQLHFQLMLRYFLQTDLKSILFLPSVICFLFIIAFTGNTQYRLKRLDNLLILHIFRIAYDRSVLHASGSLYDNMISFFNRKLHRIKIIYFPRRAETYSYYSCHNLSTSIPARNKPCLFFCSAYAKLLFLDCQQQHLHGQIKIDICFQSGFCRFDRPDNIFNTLVGTFICHFSNIL